MTAKTLTILLLCLTCLAAPQRSGSGTASAQQSSPILPDEATKMRALKRAYQLNDNSMVRWGSIDVSNDPVVFPQPPVLQDWSIKNEIDAASEGKRKRSRQ